MFVVVLFIVMPGILCEGECQMHISSIHRLFLFHNLITTIIIKLLNEYVCEVTGNYVPCSIQAPRGVGNR